MKKRLLSVSLIVMLIFSLSVNAFARWNSTSVCNTTLSFSGTTATCKLVVAAIDSTDKITAKLELKNASGTVIKTWNNISGTGRLNYSATHSPVSNGTYTLVATVTVKGSNGNDTIVVSSSATKS